MKKATLISLIVGLMICVPALGDFSAVYYSNYQWNEATMISGPQYSDLSAEGYRADVFYGVTPSGGIDYIYYSSGTSSWNNVGISVGSDTYQAVVGYSGGDDTFWAADTAGGVDYIYYSGGAWNKVDNHLSSNTYTSLCEDGVVADQLYGVNSAGGVDILYYSGGAWQSATIGTGNYVAVSGDAGEGDWVYAAKAGGGIDAIYYQSSTSTWVTANLVASGDYLDISHDAVGGDIAYGVLAGGGVDIIYYKASTSTWVAQSIGTGTYATIAGDGFDGDTTFASDIPEPATMSLMLVGGCFAALRRRRS